MLHKTALFSEGLVICIQDRSCYHSNQKSSQTVRLTCQSGASKETKPQSTKCRRFLPPGREISGQKGEDQRCHQIDTTSYWVTLAWCSHLAVNPSVTPGQPGATDIRGFGAVSASILVKGIICVFASETQIHSVDVYQAITKVYQLHKK